MAEQVIPYSSWTGCEEEVQNYKNFHVANSIKLYIKKYGTSPSTQQIAEFETNIPSSDLSLNNRQMYSRYQFQALESEIKSEYDYLTFTCTQAGGISMDIYGYDDYEIDYPNIQYSKNGEAWTTWDFTNINMSVGDVVKMKGINPHGFAFSEYDDGFDDFIYANFVMTGKIAASGNIMSLIDGEKDGTKVIPSGLFETEFGYEIYCYGFCNMFEDCSALTSAPELPATTLTSDCYNGMFQSCTNLTTAPALPATSMAKSCYQNMFHGCSTLTSAPELPATTLADICYAYMFWSCTALTSAPELPATRLANNCYNGMFYGCTGLSSVTCLATSGINQNYSTVNWLYGVAATGTFTKASSATWPTGVNGIPSGWTIVNV